MTFVDLLGLGTGVVVSGGCEDQKVVCLELFVLKLGHAGVPILELGRDLLDVTSVFLDFLNIGKGDEDINFSNGKMQKKGNRTFPKSYSVVVVVLVVEVVVVFVMTGVGNTGHGITLKLI